MKISQAVAAVALLGVTLAGCGGSDDDGKAKAGAKVDGPEYCQQLEAAKKTFAKVSQDNFDALDTAIETFHELAETAPDAVRTEWQTLNDAFGEVEKAFESAGIKMSDLGDIQRGKIPPGADMNKLASLGDSFSAITSQEVATAQADIEKHAKETCDVDLGMS